MKRLLTLAAFALLSLALGAQETLPKWEKGFLDIHTVATRCGDCTWIVMPDGTTMMVDAGDMVKSSWNCVPIPDASKTPAEWIVKYISDFSEGLPAPGKVDYMMLTHFHADHMGCAGSLRQGSRDYKVAGLSEVGEMMQVGKIVDRGWPSYDFPSAAYVEKANKGAMPDYRKFVEFVNSTGGKAERFAVGSRAQFPLAYDPAAFKGQFEIWNVAGNAQRASAKGKKLVNMYAPGDKLENFDENMFSCAFRLRYGKFVYYNGGDLSGNNYGPGKAPSHNRDYESQIAPLLGKVQVIKADHHGWKDTCNPYFLWITAPDAVIFPASHIRHPWWETVRRLIDPQLPGERELYVTTDSGKVNIDDELWSHLHKPGHIVVRVYPGGESWQVFVLDALSREHPVIEKSEIKKL